MQNKFIFIVKVKGEQGGIVQTYTLVQTVADNDKMSQQALRHMNSRNTIAVRNSSVVEVLTQLQQATIVVVDYVPL